MTVGELKAKLEGIRDEVEVVVSLPETIGSCSGSPDYMAEVSEARFVPKSSINNDEFDLKCGRTYGY
jgi:hypothetical protein